MLIKFHVNRLFKKIKNLLQYIEYRREVADIH
jgi:hypothetical protein